MIYLLTFWHEVAGIYSSPSKAAAAFDKLSPLRSSAGTWFLFGLTLNQVPELPSVDLDHMPNLLGVLDTEGEDFEDCRLNLAALRADRVVLSLVPGDLEKP